MAREHTLFVMAQDIPWDEGLYSGTRPGLRSKVLSIDEAGTDATVVVEYPAGWSADGPEHCTAHEEFLVIEGEIEINGISYGMHNYGFFPAGYVRNSASTSDGAKLLTMFYDAPQYQLGETEEPHDPKLLVEHVDPLPTEWDPGLVDPQLSAGVAIKPLRTDPYTQETSFLYMSPPHRVPPGMAKPQWTHSMVEELFCLAGTYVWGDCGRMGPGGYCWWREGVYHGPAGTDVGYMLFVRTVNGPLDNIFDTEKKPFSWDPPYNPQLPERLRKHAKPFTERPLA
ncbi:cupin domain-containing protein [Altererythrobacter sp. MF3-039]|uniref:cupin domain-containing protein n=1 Tax=Altererythrobacter sp. MF3-039 TaxID=3252901 RepID=UPI00390C5E1C